MVRNIMKTLDAWSRRYNEKFGYGSSSWNGATVRESSLYTDRAHIAIGMTSKNLKSEEWENEKDRIMHFFPRIFEIDFSIQKALIFIDERSDELQ